MVGHLGRPEGHGLIPRSCAALLAGLKAVHPAARCRVSFLEVYNEELSDLFIPAAALASASLASAGGGAEGLMSPGGFGARGFASPALGGRGVAGGRTAAAGGDALTDANVIPYETALEVMEAAAAATTAPGARGGSGGGAAALAAQLGMAAPAGAGLKAMTLVDHPQRGTVCLGLSEVEVASVEQVVRLLQLAEERSRFAATAMNKQSNRAHRIFTFVASFSRGEAAFTTSLTLVDLAGSEDIGRSGATGTTAKEASHINKSLLTLGRVINALASNAPHVPYRESKLTRLLSEAVSGRAAR
jgi:hypothetical protein